MRIATSLLSRYSSDAFLASRSAYRASVISVENGTFYRSYPSSAGPSNPSNPSMFPDLTFSLPSSSAEQQHWAVVGPSSSGKTTLLEILRGHHICIPPKARSFPYLSTAEALLGHTRSRSPSQAIKYVGFGIEDGSTGQSRVKGAYLSARYESRREETDFSVLSYLQGNTELNPSERVGEKGFDGDVLNKVIEDLRLGALINMPMSNLSNGQTRRARIAKALLGRPEVLLLDEPFSRKQNLTPHALQADEMPSGPRPINLDHAVSFAAQTCPDPITKTHTRPEATRSASELDHPHCSHRAQVTDSISGP